MSGKRWRRATPFELVDMMPASARTSGGAAIQGRNEVRQCPERCRVLLPRMHVRIQGVHVMSGGSEHQGREAKFEVVRSAQPNLSDTAVLLLPMVGGGVGGYMKLRRGQRVRPQIGNSVWARSRSPLCITGRQSAHALPHALEARQPAFRENGSSQRKNQNSLLLRKRLAASSCCATSRHSCAGVLLSREDAEIIGRSYARCILLRKSDGESAQRRRQAEITQSTQQALDVHVRTASLPTFATTAQDGS